MVRIGLAMTIVLLAAAVVEAQITQNFLVSRDNGGDANAPDANAGAAGQVRGAKNPWDEDTSYYDWSTTDLNAWINGNGGRALVQSVEFFVKPITCPGQTTTVGIHVYGLHANIDWAEGNGGDIWTAFNWSMGTAAATYNYAQEYYIDADGDPATTGDRSVDLALSLPWNNGANVGLASNSLRGIRNSLDWDPGDVGNTYYGVALDQAFWVDLLDNENNRGIILWDENDAPGLDENWEVYMRENAGGANAAYLSVTMIPEPVTMSLLVIGAAGMLLRRKR